MANAWAIAVNRLLTDTDGADMISEKEGWMYEAAGALWRGGFVPFGVRAVLNTFK